MDRARSELARKKLGKFGDHKPDTTVEEEALRRAKARMALSEKKLEVVRRWVPELQHAVEEYRTHSRPLYDVLEIDLKRAVGKLDRMLDAIESYARLSAPTTPSVSPGAGQGENMAQDRPEPSTSEPPSTPTPNPDAEPSDDERGSQ